MLRSRSTAPAPRGSVEGAYRFTEYYLPLILLAAGLVIIPAGAAWIVGSVAKGLAAGIALLGMELVIMMPLFLLTLFITAKAVGLSFGSLWTGLLKLAAICVGPGAIADVVLIAVLPYFSGLFGQVALMFITYLVALGPFLSKMFDLDAEETAITVGVAILIRLLAFFFVILILFNRLH